MCPPGIGFEYGMFQAGYGTESGDYWDTYWSGNISHKIVNEDAEFVELSPRTIPNSNSNDNAKSFIRIYGFGTRGTVMTFSVSSDLALPGFPIYAGDDFLSASLLDLDIHGEKAVVAVSQKGHVLGWKTNGKKIIENNEIVEIENLYGSQEKYDYALMTDLGKNITLSPIAFDINADGADDIIAITDDGELSIIEAVDGDANGFADIIYSVQLNAKPSAGLMGFADKIVFGDTEGRLHVLKPNSGSDPEHFALNLSPSQIVGLSLANNPMVAAVNSQLVAVSESGQVFSFNSQFEKLWDINLATSANVFYPASADFNGDGTSTITIVGNNGFIAHIDLDGNILSQQNLNSDIANMSAPALGDMDADGLPEILINTGNGYFVFETGGVESVNFPVMYKSKVSATSPVWYSNEGELVSLGSSDNLLYAYDEKAKVAGGFPIAAAGNFSASPLLTDINNDGTLDLFALSEDGFLYGWDLDLPENQYGGWLQYGGDAMRSFSYIWKSQSIVLSGDFMPSKKVFCYPNPTENNRTNIRYYLSQNAVQVSIKIYDLAGDFVQELLANGTSIGDHEVLWDVAQIESGVYLARVQADSGAKQNIEFIKIAVIK